MRFSAVIRGLALIITMMIWVAPLPASARQQANEGNILNIPDPVVTGIGYDQKLNTQVPLQLPLRDEAGKSVTLRDYLGKRPLLLGLVYYGCPHLCKLEINGIIQSLQSVAFNVGAEFEVALVSLIRRTRRKSPLKRRSRCFAFTRIPKPNAASTSSRRPKARLSR